MTFLWVNTYVLLLFHKDLVRLCNARYHNNPFLRLHKVKMTYRNIRSHVTCNSFVLKAFPSRWPEPMLKVHIYTAYIHSKATHLVLQSVFHRTFKYSKPIISLPQQPPKERVTVNYAVYIGLYNETEVAANFSDHVHDQVCPDNVFVNVYHLECMRRTNR